MVTKSYFVVELYTTFVLETPYFVIFYFFLNGTSIAGLLIFSPASQYVILNYLTKISFT